MNIEIVYVFPMIGNGQHLTHAERFVSTYLAHDPLVDHQTTIVCNGAAPNTDTKALFSMLPNVKFLTGDNSAYDISAYQQACSQSQADMIVFFGTSTYLRHRGWLLRMAQAFAKHGETQYGAMGNRGDDRFTVFPHLRTTGFWTAPRLFNAYPFKITKPEERFPFEHGRDCFTMWLSRQGIKSFVVTMTGEFRYDDWDNTKEGFHQGSQKDLICGDHLSEPPYYATP